MKWADPSMISSDLIKNVTVELLRMAVTKLPSDVEQMIQQYYEKEDNDMAKMQLKTILDNMALAEENVTPMCQDTGIHVFYVTPCKTSAEDIEKGIKEGVKEATEKVPLRPNAVHPLTRENPGTNVGERMPYINYKSSDKEYMEITVMPKGAGSENMSALAMLTSSQGLKGIKEFALNTVVNAGGKPCPPTIVGIGIGGSADISLKLAKEALLRPLGKHHPDEQIASLEEELLDAFNETGIGPMGMGGRTTVLGVHIEYASCHTASLPVGINIQCWAARRATARIHPDGTVEYLTHKAPQGGI